MKKILVVLLFSAIGSFLLYPDTGKPILTVLDFETSGISQSEMKSIINILSSGLFKSGFFTVIDVAERDTVLKELAFSMSGCTDESCMLEVGKMLSAELIVGGSIGRLGSKIVLSAKMIETETSKTVSTADGIYTDMDDLLAHIYVFRDHLSEPYLTAAGADTSAGPEAGAGRTAVESGINFPAAAAAAGGGVCLGVGAWLLAVSLPMLIDYAQAADAYESAADGADFDSLYSTAEAARLAAIEGNANTNFIAGASIAGGGIVLGIISAILFTSDEKGSERAAGSGPVLGAAVIPAHGAVTLSFRLR